MSIQDIILSVGAIVLAAALVPSIMTKDKPALPTSIITGTTLYIFAGVYASLALWTACITTAISATMWLILVIQKMRQDILKK